MSQARGTFEVTVTPLPADEKVAGLTVGRVAIDKRFKGGLVATSKGEMMTVDTGVEGSGAYVAIEQVTGSLDGRRGTFTLVHRGTMQKGGDYQLAISVVPDSGTGELVGLAGTVRITIAAGVHSYELDYTLSDG